MCKLCERESKDLSKGNLSSTLSLVSPDRLAVLERDHRAMERLREENIYLICCGEGKTAKDISVVNQDPADAILAEGEK